MFRVLDVCPGAKRPHEDEDSQPGTFCREPRALHMGRLCLIAFGVYAAALDEEVSEMSLFLLCREASRSGTPFLVYLGFHYGV